MQSYLPFLMNSVGRGTSPLVLPGEKRKPWAKTMVLTCLCSPVCPYSQGLEIPTYFQGNLCWSSAFLLPPQLGVPSTNTGTQDFTQFMEFIHLKFLLPLNPPLFFFFPPVLLNRISSRPDFLQEQVQFKFWQPHQHCFKQLWKSILGQSAEFQNLLATLEVV